MEWPPFSLLRVTPGHEQPLAISGSAFRRCCSGLAEHQFTSSLQRFDPVARGGLEGPTAADPIIGLACPTIEGALDPVGNKGLVEGLALPTEHPGQRPVVMGQFIDSLSLCEAMTSQATPFKLSLLSAI
jgi:hypothetical protein